MANNSGVVSIHGREYKTVALRVQEFRESHPDWGISTLIVDRDADMVVIKASITDAEGKTIGEGHAEERRNASQINRTSALENCETSAIGRALAACGFGGSEYASANEVENAIHQQQTEKVKISPKVVSKVVEQSLEAIAASDEHGLMEIWSEFDADEKAVLWGKFNSQQRATMKAMMGANK